MGVLATIEKRKAFTAVEKVFAWLNRLFRYAVVTAEGGGVNPTADLDVVAEPKLLMAYALICICPSCLSPFRSSDLQSSRLAALAWRPLAAWISKPPKSARCALSAARA